MATEKQVQANRRNALKSTGPKTQTGKAVASKNAMRHGLLARDVVIKGEDPEAFNAMQEALVLELTPEGAIEEQLVDRIAAAFWRLRRLGRVEADIFEFEAISRAHSDAKAELRKLEDEHREDSFPRLDQSTAERDEPKAYKAAMAKISATAKALSEMSPSLGAAFISDAKASNSLSKLSRYETAIERSLYRALKELEWLQQARVPKEPVLSEAVDITVDENQVEDN
jgi:hypothetical protein